MTSTDSPKGSENRWQPISTAPMDGTRVLLWAKDFYGDAGCFVAEWRNKYNDWNIPGVGGYEWEVEIREAAYWMALPDPPRSDLTYKGIPIIGLIQVDDL